MKSIVFLIFSSLLYKVDLKNIDYKIMSIINKTFFYIVSLKARYDMIGVQRSTVSQGECPSSRCSSAGWMPECQVGG